MVSNLSCASSFGQDQNVIFRALSSWHIGCASLKPVMLVLKPGEEVELDVVWVQGPYVESSVGSDYFGND